MTPPASGMRGRYLVRNRALFAALASADWLASRFVKRTSEPASPPRKMLIAVGGHRGDAVMATAALSDARRFLPDIELGVITPSWNREIFAGHPHVAHLHTLDHWRLQRAPVGVPRKLTRHASSFRRALREVNDVGYDMALDLYPYFPNASRFLWRAGIPRRVGYASGGGGPWYTRAVEWRDDRRPIVAKQRDLLAIAIDGSPDHWPAAAYHLTPVAADARERAAATLARAGVGAPFLVMHAGAGARRKEWPIERWRALVELTRSLPFPIVLTGYGDAESRAAARIANGSPRVANLAGAFGWAEFVHVLSSAAALVTVDTVAAHVGAGVGTPTLVLFSGINDLREWMPLGSSVVPLIDAVPCAPCMNASGCATMQCVRGVAPERVFMELQRVLAAA